MKNKEALSLILKCTRECNLRCEYCMDWKKKSFEILDINKISLLFKNLDSIKEVKSINFIWHGGEPLLLGLPFFRKVYFLQNQLFGKSSFRNILQTNGTLITNDWANHFKEYNFSIGVSVDGTRETHNLNRSFPDGIGSYEESMKGISILKKSGLKFGILTVVSDDILSLGPKKLINSYIEKGIYNYALLSMRKNWHKNSDALIYNKLYGSFILTAIDYWLKKDNINLNIRELNSKMDILFNLPGRVCKDCGECVGKYFGIEASGDVYHCDKFSSDNRFFFGNIFKDSFDCIIKSKNFKNAVKLELKIRQGCRICKWHNICKGGCLSDLVSLDLYGGRRGTEDCINYQMYQSTSESLINYFPKKCITSNATIN